MLYSLPMFDALSSYTYYLEPHRNLKGGGGIDEIGTFRLGKGGGWERLMVIEANRNCII